MKKIFFVCVLSLIVCTSAFATTWIQIDDTDYMDKDSIKYYIDDHGSTSISKKTVWMKDINMDNPGYKEIEKLTNKHISYVLSQCIFDFKNNTKAIKAGIIYDKNGNPISQYSFKDFQLEWSPIAPNSKAEYWAKLVKSPRKLKKLYKYQQITTN